MRFPTFLKVIFLSFLLLNTASFGQEIITLEEAVSRALKSNNQIKASNYDAKKTDWQIKNAWSQLLPDINLNTRFTRIDDQTFAERDFRRYFPPDLRDQFPQTVFQESFYTSVDLNMPIFNGSILNGIYIASESGKAAESLNKSVRENIAFQVVRTYLETLKSEEILKIQKEYLELSERNYNKAERLFKAGRYSKNEALRWKVDMQQQKSSVVSSRNVFRSNKINLNKLLNMQLFSEIELSSKLPEWLLNISNRILSLNDKDIIELIRLSDSELTTSNAQLNAAEANTEIQRLIYKNSYNSYLPNVSLSYSYAWRENETIDLDDYSPKTLSLNLRVPIFSGFKNYTNLKTNFYDYKKSEEEFKDQLKQTKSVLTTIANNLINLKTQIELSELNVEFSSNNYNVVSTQRDKGLVSNIDFIDAKLNLQNAKVTQINNKYDFYSAVVELYYMIGKLDNIIN